MKSFSCMVLSHLFLFAVVRGSVLTKSIQKEGQSTRRQNLFADIDIHLARRLGARREQLGMSRNELDCLIGERPGTVARFERGARRLGADHMYYLAGALEVPVAWSFDGLETAHYRTVLELPKDANEVEIDAVLAAFHGIKNDTVRRDVLGLTRAMAAAGTPRRG